MQTEILKVTGMTCGGCSNTVTQALQAVTGVGEVSVSLPDGLATVQFDELQASPGQLKAAVKEAGYGVEDSGNASRVPRTGGCGCGCG